MMVRLLLIVMSLWVWNAQASPIETYRFESPGREALYKKMITELRCLVCQNQNLADSNAELAQDLRRKTYEMVTAGENEQEIVAYMVARYGNFVLYRPPLNKTTLFLWGGPFIILIIALFILIRVVRQRSAAAGDDGLSEEQHAKARDLLKGGEE